MQSAILDDAGDITYPHNLISGWISEAPATLSTKPEPRIRMRIINAGSDIAFRVALADRLVIVSHVDGLPVTPVRADAVMVGMSERYDITLRDGVFPLLASADGQNGHGLAVVRIGSGRTPQPDIHPAQLERRVLLGTDLSAVERVALAEISTSTTPASGPNTATTPTKRRPGC